MAKGLVICPLSGRSITNTELIPIGEYTIAYINTSFLWTTVNLPEISILENAYQDFDAGLLSRKNFDQYVSQAKSILLREFNRAGINESQLGDLRFFDYGCGGGHFVAAADSFGMQAVGMEIDEEAAVAAKDRGLNVINGYLPHDMKKLERSSFHVIKLMHVLEHVPNPRLLIASLISMLVPGGILIISVPDQRSFPSKLKIFLRLLGIKKNEYGFVQPPIHLHGFSSSSIDVIAKENSLELINLENTSPLDNTAFPSTKEYWKKLKLQKIVYMIGRFIGSGGHITAILRRPK